MNIGIYRNGLEHGNARETVISARKTVERSLNESATICWILNLLNVLY